MNKVSEFVDENKQLAIFSVLTLILIVIGLICFSTKNAGKTEEKKVLEEYAYTMYLKEEAIIKLTIRESFYRCGSNICSEYTDKISNIELLNDTANNIYTEHNVKNKDLDEGISMLLIEARDKGHNISTLQIISNWKSRYTEEEFKELLRPFMEIIPEYPIIFEYREELDEQSIIEGAEKKTYTVSFDSNLGTLVDNQIVVENELAIEPTAPTRDGYDFVKWQYNNRTFSFDTPITQDYELKASWKKKPTVSTKETTKKTTKAPDTEVTEPAPNEPTTENQNTEEQNTEKPNEQPDNQTENNDTEN